MEMCRSWKRLMSARSAICLLYVILLILVSTVESQSCENATENVVFLGFVPCSLSDGINGTRDLLAECDLLVQAALELAVERINQSPDILTNTTLHVLQISDSSEDTVLEPVTEAFRADEYFGVIGPSNSQVAEFWTPIFDRFNLLTVSYAVTSTAPDKTSSFYRTLPSFRSANIGRLVLIVRNNWFRFASITSNEAYYAKEVEDFIHTFNKPIRTRNYSVELALPTSFSDAPYTALRDIKQRDLNIIMGFFGPENARNVLCIADSMELVSPNHTWVLPAYYNPNWWRQSANGQPSDCSDNQMENILESVIFIDTVKFPSVDKPLTEFHRQLVAKALDLFPSLTEEDLKPYLLRSRATNAYDAVTLLARSVGVAFDQGGNNCTDSNLVQVVLEKIFMQCEYCRLYSGCFLSSRNQTAQCLELCGPDFIPNLTPERFAHMYTNVDVEELRADHLLNYFGQVFYSQFTGGVECPTGLLWTSSSGNLSLVKDERIYTLEELDESPCAVRLNLSKQMFMREGCPLTFQWRGSSVPPSSGFEMFLSLSLAEIIIIGLLTGLGLVVAVALIMFNIVWRANKAVKASSPWLNVVLLVGIIIRLPSALLSGLAVSSIAYEINIIHSAPICYFETWFYHLGEAVFLASLIAKNWRIYLIFNNKSLKMIGAKLSDQRLMILILLFVLPVIVILIVWSRLDCGIYLETTPSQNENLQLIRVPFCTSTYHIEFKITAISYAAFLLALLFVLTFLALRTTMSTFHREGELSYQATAITLFPVPIFTIIYTFATTSGVFEEGMLHLINVWIEFTLGVLLPILIMLVLFLPNIYVVLLKERLKKRFSVKKKEMETLESHDLSNRYHSLRQQSASLKLQLSETNQLIAKLIAEEQKHPVEHTSPLTTDSTHSDSDTKDDAVSTVSKKISEHAHQTHGEQRQLEMSSLSTRASEAVTSGNDTRGSSEQCSEVNTRLCVTTYSSSPSNLQENHCDEQNTEWETELLNKETTMDDSRISVEVSNQLLCNEVDTIVLRTKHEFESATDTATEFSGVSVATQELECQLSATFEESTSRGDQSPSDSS